MPNSSGAFILFRILKGFSNDNICRIKQMVVNVSDEVCGDKLTISNSQRYVLEMWRAEDDKFREYQPLVGRQDSDSSKITVLWAVS